MDHENERAARQGANLARHLNQSYPDTVLFLARHAAGRPDAVEARLDSVTADELVLTVTAAGGTAVVRVPLSAAPGAAPDVRGRVRALLAVARQAAPGEPLTSLEKQVGPPG